MMGGLLLKDFYMTARYCKIILLGIAVFLVGIGLGEQVSFSILIYPTVIVSVLPVTLLSYDERDKWNQYSATLPYSRAQLVSVKYLVGMLLGSAAYLLSLGAVAIQMARNNSFSLEAFFSMALVLFLFACFCPIFLFPCVFKWGVEKARIAFYASVGLIFGVGAVLTKKLFSATATPLRLSIFSLESLWTLGCLAGAALLLYAFSWRLSIQFYCKREL